MSRCLVTGHRGYIGSRLFKALINLGHEVRGIDIKDGCDINTTRGLKQDVRGNFSTYWVDFQPEYIFHLACMPRVGYSIEFPVKTMKNNVLAGSNVLNFARHNGTKRVIYSSSSSIKGNGSGPTNPYALQKMTTEIECRLYSELYNVDTVSLRYFNVYSEDQEADGPYSTAVCNWMKHITKNQIPFITGDGTQRRDMLHVTDAISANIFAMQREHDFLGNTYDVGTGKNISLNEVKDIVKEYFPDTKFMYTNSRPNEVRNTLADIHPLKNIGWESNISIERGINSCFNELKRRLKC